jgi:hypothetical protein
MRETQSRRGPGVGIATMAVVLLVAGVAVVALGVLKTREDGETAAPIIADTGRKPWQVSIDLDISAGFLVTSAVVDAGRQTLTVQNIGFNDNPAGAYGGEVSAFEPGVLDENQLRGGEAVNIDVDLDARYVPAYTFAAHGDGAAQQWQTPAVGWQDPSGTWVLVYGDETTTKESLLKLAGAVRLGTPRDLRMPFRLGGGFPDGLAPTYVQAPENKVGGLPPTVGLSVPDRAPSRAAVYRTESPSLDLSVSALAPDAQWATTRKKLGPAAKVAGHDTWFSPGLLTAEAERCIIQVHAAKAVPRDQLSRIVEEMTIGDCTDLDSWIPPLA